MALSVGVAVVCGALAGVAIHGPSSPGDTRAPDRGSRRSTPRVRAVQDGISNGAPAKREWSDGRAAEPPQLLSLSVMTPFAPPRPALEIDAILDADQDAAWKVREVARMPAERRGAAITALAAALGRDPSVAESLASMLRTATGDDLDALTRALREGATFQARDEIRPVALEVLRHDPDERRRIAAAWALRYAGGDPLPEYARREILAAIREERSWVVVAALGEAVTGGVGRDELAAALDDVLARIESGRDRVRVNDARWNPFGARTSFSVVLQRFDEAVGQEERDEIAAEILRRTSGRAVGMRSRDAEAWPDRVARQTSRQAAFLRVYGGTSDGSVRARLVCEIAETPWDCFDASRADADGLRRAYSAFVREIAAIEPVESVAERLRAIAERVEAGGERASAADFPKSRKGG